jgi:hypothetical protein
MQLPSSAKKVFLIAKQTLFAWFSKAFCTKALKILQDEWNLIVYYAPIS